MKFSKRSTAVVLAGILGFAALTGCEEAGIQFDTSGLNPSSTTEAPAAPSAEVDAAGALQKLDTIEVKGRAPKTGYDRDNFGTAWKDVDRNGCDTRNDILARDLTQVEYKDGTQECVVASGVLQDDYTGTTIEFLRGQKTSTSVQIDHLVPLSEAWQKGAQQWTEEKREQFANDPINLRATDGPTNGSKSDSDLATWLPPNRAYWCEYTADIVEVKSVYGVWMTQAEHDKAAEILNSCN